MQRKRRRSRQQNSLPIARPPEIASVQRPHVHGTVTATVSTPFLCAGLYPTAEKNSNNTGHGIRLKFIIRDRITALYNAIIKMYRFFLHKHVPIEENDIYFFIIKCFIYFFLFERITVGQWLPSWFC